MRDKNKASMRIMCALLILCLFLCGGCRDGEFRDDAQLQVANRCVDEETLLLPGGMIFGVKFFTEGVLVVGLDEGRKSPAFAAGVRVNDVIIKVDGVRVNDACALCDAIDATEGRQVELTCLRNGEELKLRVTPRKTENGYKTGITVRDSGAGIGTVTYIDPESGLFGGLGHGICDPDTGKPMPLGRGILLGVSIGGIKKGVSGAPGEIRGSFQGGKLGAVTGNTECGIFGIYSDLPKPLYPAMKIGKRNEITEGEATILCTLDERGICEYKAELSDINRKADGGRCFTVKVTDDRLLSLSGGIVQGMSGSPIIQNGKIVGAVTHVLINDPTTGYGIFIENMLSASKMPIAKAA